MSGCRCIPSQVRALSKYPYIQALGRTENRAFSSNSAGEVSGVGVSPGKVSTAKDDEEQSSSSHGKSPRAIPSDERRRRLARMLRVDHAGEIGARQIYAGQLAVFGGTRVGGIIAHMAEQEQKHLDAFDRLVVERRVRPTAMLPIWNVAGYSLGLGTALLGKEAAMACTVAVEEVIAEHYADQVNELSKEGWESEVEIREMFREFREDELEHKDTGYEHDAVKAPMYRALSSAIKAGCRGAIFITERV